MEDFKSVEVIYVGKRLSKSNTWIYQYEDVSKNRLNFKNKLKKSDVIGDIIEVISNGTTFKESKKVGTSNEVDIALYSIQQQHHIEWKEEIQAAKLIPNGHVKKLIEAIRANTTLIERKRLALYIYREVLK